MRLCLHRQTLELERAPCEEFLTYWGGHRSQYPPWTDESPLTPAPGIARPSGILGYIGTETDFKNLKTKFQGWWDDGSAGKSTCDQEEPTTCIFPQEKSPNVLLTSLQYKHLVFCTFHQLLVLFLFLMSIGGPREGAQQLRAFVLL